MPRQMPVFASMLTRVVCASRRCGGSTPATTAAPVTVSTTSGDPPSAGRLVGVVPAGAVGASLPTVLAATAAGLFVATIWSANLGQSAVASVFGISPVSG